MIIVGYQGIGKSTLAGKFNCIDLESSNFWVDGKRSDDWYKIYCSIAVNLSQQGFIVFTSSHEVVRNELSKYGERTVVVYPAVALKDQWIDKLRVRYEATGLEKDFKALANAEDRYEDNINELKHCNLECFEITDIDYDLRSIIDSIL